MSTRAAIRPRPLDINKQLLIVKDVSELDSSDALAITAEASNHFSEAGQTHGHGHGHGSSQKKPKAIPIPDIREVETHYRDYLPLFSVPVTYLHGRGCGGNRDPEPVEYDLDNEDEDWLKQYNLGRSKLSDIVFERMLWRLEVECAAATDTALVAAGAGLSERTAAGAVAAIDHLSRNEAIRKLALDCGGREKLLWDVYSYWATKRKKWGKPILRRLQAPTLASDTNPYNTFRSREKVNRPQTRRRRDNSDELMEKLRQMRDNLMGAKQILEEVVRRERRKRDLACTEVELLSIQYRARHEDKSHDQISTEALNRLRERMKINGQADQIRAGMRLLANKTTLPPGMSLSRKRRHDEVLRCLRPLAATLMATPPTVEPELLWGMPANLLQIPLESKELARDRMDDIRKGKPVLPPGAAARMYLDGAGAGAGAAAIATQPSAAGAAATAGAAAAGSAGGAAAPAPAGGAAESSEAAGAPTALAGGSGSAAAASAGGAAPAAASTTGAAAGQQQHPAALPPAGPPSAALGGRMNAVVAALAERQHLYRLPDGLAGNITSWRCFIGRGGRARLERIDHVTHESLNAIKQEQSAVQQHYASEPWPPMPTAPLLRELVEKSRPPGRSGVARSGSVGLASQASAGVMGVGPGQRRNSSSNMAQMQQQQQQQAAAAAATAGNGPGGPTQQPVQMQQQAVPQQAHGVRPHLQQQQQQPPIQPGQTGYDQEQQQQQAVADAAVADAGGQGHTQGQQQQQTADPSSLAAAQQQQQTGTPAVQPPPPQQQQPVAMPAAQPLAGTGSLYPGGAAPAAAGIAAAGAAPTAAAGAPGPTMTSTAYPDMAAGAPAAAQLHDQHQGMQAVPSHQVDTTGQAAASMQPQQPQQDPAAVAAAAGPPQSYSGAPSDAGGVAYDGGMDAESMMTPGNAAAVAATKRTPAIKSGSAAGAVAAPAGSAGLPPTTARKGPGRPPKSSKSGVLNGVDA